ncbi:oxygen-insensitive NADPH nitroreductase [Alysiella filiformis]|uniref:Nitroreductase n=1 Tax=Alysiella filiformis DSM 16848 TaxID=1120981 RepID=A0A286EJW0_9NEIS|nr:oxygen-insensitive NADPH nitroreductase [Alysiella filiformis]QMT30696.1 oxygen-insensitive NADPH nitroreductase [Alysiella filiformis]UBQ56324.1 oxygen-insensitive NADPH nitroreductase [Alysiella filiformis DSM 16848]SOD71225.1 nitroreductase [Alysiella filiformis DSM 16848]
MQNHSSALQTALAHRSIRKFTEQAIDRETLSQLIYAGQMASTSSYMQNVSVIRVSDPAKRAQIRAICTQATGGKGHAYVEHCAEFLVFCIDGSRHKHFAPHAQLDWTEVLLVGAVDVGIFAQNVMLAAESIGLGGVYIGSIRNNMAQAAEILQTPDYVVPLVGMCLGYPDQDPAQRPRLPLDNVLFENEYGAPNETALSEYNQVVKQYYQERSNLDLSWQQQIENNLCTEVRPEMLAFLQSKGFAKR